MQDYEAKEILENEIFIEGNCPDIVIDGGFSVENISDVYFTVNTPDFFSGTCTIDTNHPDGGDVPLYGEFEITINDGSNVVIFKNFNLE